MLIGLTYDLRSAYLAEGYSEEQTAEFDRDDTIDAIESALITLGHSTARIGNARELVMRLAAGERWDLVFNICEGLWGSARESQVPCILDAHRIPYTFSDAEVLSLSLNKAWTKAVLSGVVPTSPYQVIRSPAELKTIEIPPLPLFVKPISEGTGKGIDAESIVRSRGQLAARCMNLLSRFHQPVLVEPYLPGRELTVSLIGTARDARVLGTLEIVMLDASDRDVYGYLTKEECEERVSYVHVPSDDPVVARAEEYALRAWRHLGCRDAGRVDFRCDESGEPNFVEVNPLAGLHPHHSDLPMLATAIGMSYTDLIREIVISARSRTVSRGAISAVA